jgi:hypothetical protein
VAARSAQLALNFEPGLTTRFRTLEDCIAHIVHNSRRGVDGVAQDIDMGASELTRRLNAHLDAKAGDASNRPMRVADLVGVMRSTKDYRPIHWLIEEFLQDPEAARELALQQIPQAVEVLVALAAQAGVQLARTSKK